MTKAEIIKEMTETELAALFYDMSRHKYDYPYSYEAWVCWMKQVVDDG